MNSFLLCSRSDGQLRHTSTSTSNYNTSASDMPAYLRGFDSSLHTRKDGKSFKVYRERNYDFLYFSLNFNYRSYVPLLLTFGYRIMIYYIILVPLAPCTKCKLRIFK